MLSRYGRGLQGTNPEDMRAVKRTYICMRTSICLNELNVAHVVHDELSHGMDFV